MAYVRKTTDQWDVLCDYGYGHGPEVVTSENTKKEAMQRAREYSENDTAVLCVIVKKVRVRK